jgi:predicted nucleic acid-binding protein
LIVFVDSSALKANYDSGDGHHAETRQLMQKIQARQTDITSFLTTDYVLDEAITLTRFAHSHAKAAELAGAILSSRFIRLIYAGEVLFSAGMKTFKQHSDKEWSFTDCVSFAAMKAEGVRTAFTFDAHFKQAGFDVIP